ncbi:MAG: hypothetical protein QW756_01090 [Nitrososphaerota archaeon]
MLGPVLWIILFGSLALTAEGQPLVDVGPLTHLAGTAGAAYPQITPWGDYVAYYMAGDLWMMSLETGERTTIVVSPWWESRFSISADGKLLAFTSERGLGGRTVVCLYAVGAGERGCLSPLAEVTYVCGPQSWSVDSLLVCGMEPERSERADVGIISTLAGISLRWRAWMWEVKPSGEKVKTILEDEGLLYSVLGPDGKILYTSNNDKPPTIWLLDTASGEKKPLIINGLFPAWSPDGGLIAFVRGGELWISSAEGGREQQITYGLGRVVTPTWSPDGSKIFFARFPALDEDRASSGLYYVEVVVRKELPVMAVASTIALTAVVMALLLGFRAGSQTNLKGPYPQSQACPAGG